MPPKSTRAIGMPPSSCSSVILPGTARHIELTPWYRVERAFGVREPRQTTARFDGGRRLTFQRSRWVILRSAMTVKAIPFVITATFVFAFVASGPTPADQSVEKVFHFTYTETPQGVQEIVNIMRSITEVPQGAADNAARTMTLH